MDLLQEALNSITPLDEKAMAKAKERQDQLTKPAGSLGVLEEISVQLAGIVGNVINDVGNKTVIVMAGDHGVVDEGVSAFPKEVTPQMVANFVNGGAAINVLSRHVGAKVVVVDVGVAVPIEDESVISRKVRSGTANFVKEPAMLREEAVKALETGIEIAYQQVDDGVNLLATGDMGIGNTTPSSAILVALTGRPVDGLVGRGTGIGNGDLDHKKKVITDAIDLLKPNKNDPIDVLAKIGGLEIGGLAGLIIGAAARRVPVVIDGFISGVAALIANRINPLCKGYMIASHVSVEPGHRLILEELGLKPMLHMDMRLGEGAGAVLAMGMVEAAAKIIKEMATFTEANISEKEEGK
ncbi:MAG: nicotinate-nucleotide--dimethylbenzimidazole phosphoribosyltransferase [Actinobacteria bacterium]|nr:nicotinate-nucleotide--dimethylbenzimidazole phosphoribosyltransferase [Actinomycetota bacterium]